jgi:hypothetical protein
MVTVIPGGMMAMSPFLGTPAPPQVAEAFQVPFCDAVNVLACTETIDRPSNRLAVNGKIFLIGKVFYLSGCPLRLEKRIKNDIKKNTNCAQLVF